MTEMNDKYLLVGSEVLSREFNDLGSFYSDFHKDVHGTRPRHMALCASDYPDHESLVEAMSHLDRLVQGLQDYMDAMKATFQGREQLRDEGWQIDETDPSCVSLAVASQALRDADRARMEYECSWEYHQEQEAAKNAAAREAFKDDLESFLYNKYEARA